MISFSYGQSDHQKIRRILRYALITVASGCRRVVYCNILRGERNRKHLQHARRKRAARRRHARNATVLHLFAVLRLQSAVFILLFSVQQGRLCPAHNRFERSCDNHSDCIPLLISVEDDGALAGNPGCGTRYACRDADDIHPNPLQKARAYTLSRI